MPELPDRPDLGQLRRQARGLQRAATAGNEDALRRVRSVSGTVTLAAAQLAVARDFGFASWPRLKAEVERRRAAVNDSGRESPEAAALAPILAAWRNLPAEQQALVARQYADRPGLRPILDAVLAAAAALGPATVEARVTVVSLVSPRRTFASIKATTKTRVDLGLRLENVTPAGRLPDAGCPLGLGGRYCAPSNRLGTFATRPPGLAMAPVRSLLWGAGGAEAGGAEAGGAEAGGAEAGGDAVRWRGRWRRGRAR
jgi:Domain of unknown function (DUF5655)